MTPVSRSQATTLGGRLRAAPTIADVAPGDAELLQELRAQCDAQLAVVRQRLASSLPDTDVTSRLKTIQTIHEKLIRQPEMSLGRMADIAGVRVVKDMERIEQDHVAAVILELWPVGKVVDRRQTPSFGYRAVHVLVREGGVDVEVQIRTRLQNVWAQVVERLGDAWGRQIRYGQPPSDADRIVANAYTRQMVWEIVQQLGDGIDEEEVLGAKVAEVRAYALSLRPSRERAGVLRSLTALEANRRKRVNEALRTLQILSEPPHLL